MLNDKVYSGIGFNQSNQWVYKEVSAGVPSGFSYLTTKTTTGTGKTDSSTKWNLSIPVIQTGDTSCGCAGEVLRTTYLKFDASFAAGSTAAERLDAYERLVDLVASPAFKASLVDLTQASTTSI